MCEHLSLNSDSKFKTLILANSKSFKLQHSLCEGNYLKMFSTANLINNCGNGTRVFPMLSVSLDSDIKVPSLSYAGLTKKWKSGTLKSAASRPFVL